MTYAVVLREPEIPKEHVGAIADALVNATGISRFDAIQRLRRVEGVLLDQAEAALAKALAEVVRRLGIEAGVAEADAASRYKRRVLVRRAECTDAGIRVHEDPDEGRLAPWNTIRAGSLARYREPKILTRGGSPKRGIGHLALGVAATLGVTFSSGTRDALLARDAIRGKQQAGSDETYVLYLFADPGINLRFDARKFHYAYLKDRMHERWDLNFHALIGDIASRATDAAFSPAVESFLKGNLLADATVTELHEFELFNRWFLLALDAFRSK